ncbi:2-dehydro-3-deoxy-phosphogluconate aldolase [Gracilibacillus timonensis]|uniref:2-dehydro-3-deoxy-phosphogluconate aldolase n=1 Tax=Gracilibacillus timonensis TaxID=1816696 RepID=UPI0008264A38|nr:KDGP aldolase [Gracilibacillus timonensis]
MSITDHFYKNRVAINVLANSIANAQEIYQTAEGFALIGVLSKDYDNVPSAVHAMKEYGSAINDAVSIGLGAGDSKQGKVVADIVHTYPGKHVNQVFPFVGYTRAKAGTDKSWINCLVTPTGQPGYVNISTGPHSEQGEKAIVSIHSAINLIKDMGGNAIKYFPMKGLSTKDEYQAVATACGKADFALEPTGGIDLDNFSDILEIALAAKVPKVIPHVYSSIIDKETGATKTEDIEQLLTEVKKLVNQYG